MSTKRLISAVGAAALLVCSLAALVAAGCGHASSPVESQANSNLKAAAAQLKTAPQSQTSEQQWLNSQNDMPAAEKASIAKSTGQSPGAGASTQ